MKLHVIAGPRSTGPRTCWADEAVRLLVGVDLTEGTSYDICTPIPLWPAMFQSISEAVFSHLGTTFRLAETPEDIDGNGVVNERDLEVFVDGYPTSPVSRSRAVVWTYDGAANAIRFRVPFLPAVGSDIEVKYKVLCDGGE